MTLALRIKSAEPYSPISVAAYNRYGRRVCQEWTPLLHRGHQLDATSRSSIRGCGVKEARQSSKLQVRVRLALCPLQFGLVAKRQTHYVERRSSEFKSRRDHQFMLAELICKIVGHDWIEISKRRGRHGDIRYQCARCLLEDIEYTNYN